MQHYHWGREVLEANLVRWVSYMEMTRGGGLGTSLSWAQMHLPHEDNGKDHLLGPKSTENKCPHMAVAWEQEDNLNTKFKN